MKRIKILHLIQTFLAGGIERFLNEFFKNFDQENFHHKIIIVENRVNDLFIKQLLLTRAEVVFLNMEPNLIETKNHQPVVEALNSIIQDFHPDMIHTHDLASLSIALLLLDSCQIPVRIHTIHTEPPPLAVDQVTNVVNKYQFTLVTPSYYIKEKIARDYHLTKAPVPIYYGIDLHGLKMKPDYNNERGIIRLINVARFSTEKGHEFLIDTFKMVCEIHENVELVLVGDGPLRDVIHTKITNYHLNDQVKMLGIRGDIPDLLNSSDIYVWTSFYETLGIAVVEAMATGLPVVSTNSAGPSAELVTNGVNGFLVNPDPLLMARAIVKLVKSQNLRAEMGRKGIEMAGRFDIKIAAAKYDDFYREQFQK